ncbi:MAG TPA: 3-deoxy-D-manno-octulosonic acid transferase [Pirellulales bacterium]|nr:3-deoxy-D-manno-octulosonic acid transferase [Pirellulales bacterium]
MSYLLNVLYLGVLALASPWLLWQGIRKGKYRDGFAAKFLGQVPRRESDRPGIWFHAVSVGEVNLLATLLARIAARRPDCECLISTTTMTGYALARKKYPELTVFYCPLDFTWAVRRAVARIRPTLLVLAELELWPNLVRLSHAAGVKVAIVNGRLSERSFRGYQFCRWLVRPLLERIDYIGAQNQEYAERFTALGARSQTVLVTGSIKFDGAETDRHNPATERLRALAGFALDDIVFLAGSTQDPEESLALAAFRELAPAHPRLQLVLVPRHPDRFAAVAALLDASGIAWQRCTDMDTAPRDPAARVLLIDAVGELGAWWGTADIGFVGGSLSNRGGQNMIEPAAYGVAVSFGPNTQNFRDIVAALLAERAAIVVQNGAELTAYVRRALAEPHFAAELGHRAKAFVARQLGATETTLAALLLLLGNARATIPADRSAA